MDPQWQSTAVLSAAALDSLYALNRDYLELLARTRQRQPSRRRSRALPQRIAHAVAQLDPVRRQALAQSPYALFDARFLEGRYWAQLAQSTQEPHDPDTCNCALTRFSHSALFFAWHLARADPFAARIMLGMSDRTRHVLTPLTVSRLQHLATRHPTLITPRWPDRETVWRILLGAARRGPAHMADTRMFGIQLIAGDLTASPD